jgi:hypothetical protein
MPSASIDIQTILAMEKKLSARLNDKYFHNNLPYFSSNIKIELILFL